MGERLPFTYTYDQNENMTSELQEGWRNGQRANVFRYAYDMAQMDFGRSSAMKFGATLSGSGPMDPRSSSIIWGTLSTSLLAL